MRNTSKLAIAINYFEKQAIVGDAILGTGIGGLAGAADGYYRGGTEGIGAGLTAGAQSGAAVGLGNGLGSLAGSAILPRLAESSKIPLWLKALLMGGTAALPIAGALGGYALNPYSRPPQTPPKQ